MKGTIRKKLLTTAALTLALATGVCGTGFGSIAAKGASKEGSVLNIYTWNEEFKMRVADHYPGYKEIDDGTGKIGDVTVNWIIAPSIDDAYQYNLDMNLANQSSLPADEKVDIFLVEGYYALKYTDSKLAMSIEDLGIKNSDLKNQFKYTQDIMTDSKGTLRGLTWQACPGVLVYNREIAKAVLGTDKPDKVQKYVSNWKKFNETAEKVAKKGYKMTATVMDTYRVYADNAKSKWVKNKKVTVDKNLAAWAKDTKALLGEGATSADYMWADTWMDGFNDGVFCYFGPAWFVDYCMGGNIASDGGWAVTTGPQSFNWGGSFICAATGTDNPTLVSKIMKTLTCDAKVMKDIAEEDGDFVNNEKVMKKLSKSGVKNSILGGQNPIPYYIKSAKSLRQKNQTIYDESMDLWFQNVMFEYFADNTTYDGALKNFYDVALSQYPELKK